jgi:hypothetical protein
MASAAPLSSRLVRLGALATLAHLVLDGVTCLLPATTPPYLLVEYAGELFSDLLGANRVGVAIAAALVDGAIAALAAIAIDEAAPRRRWAVLAGVLSGLWFFSGGLLILVYLSPPAWIAVGSLAAGVPRALVIAWVLDRALGRVPAPEVAGAADRPPGA